MTRTNTSDLRMRVLVGAVFALAVAACSLIVNSDAEQCSGPSDCAKFAGTVCQAGFCVSASSVVDGGNDDGSSGSSGTSGSDGGDSGTVDAGCVPLTSTPAELANDTCTGADCVPFDNCARLGVCDGGLPLLVTPPVGGVP